MYLEVVRPKPSCDKRVLVEAVRLEERVAPKPSCDKLVLLEAAGLEEKGGSFAGSCGAGGKGGSQAKP